MPTGISLAGIRASLTCNRTGLVRAAPGERTSTEAIGATTAAAGLPTAVTMSTPSPAGPQCRNRSSQGIRGGTESLRITTKVPAAETACRGNGCDMRRVTWDGFQWV